MPEHFVDVVDVVREALKDVRDFAIVKEFIQNADDSGATHWVMGYSEGIHDCQHPLLKSPAIYVVNSGTFKEQHAKGIAYIFKSSKADEGDAVGKFGLGLKSVYQLCEAFFFWPQSNSEEIFDKHPGCNMMNPWKNSDYERPDWEKVWEKHRDADISKIRQYLAAQGVLDGFTLWIPLRHKEQLEFEGEIQFIHDECYEAGQYPEKIFSPNLTDKLVSLWPMLRKIETMEVRAPNQQLVSISLVSDARMKYPRSPEEQCSDDVFAVELESDKRVALPKKRPLQGEIKQEDKVRSWFAGFESSVPELVSCRESSHWPKRSRGGGREGTIYVRDKSTPHAAAIFQLLQQESNTPSQLDIQWAVFFPVGDAQSLDIPLQGVRIQLLLHGFFLLDADRKSISALQGNDLEKALKKDQLESPQDLEHLWNAKLATEGTLKLVLPALDAFAKQLKVIDADTYEERITALTQALQHSNFFGDYREYLTAEWQWVKRVNADASATWQLVQASDDVFVLSYPKVTFQIFPELKTLCKKYVFIEAKSPSLTNKDSHQKWTGEILTSCLPADASKMQELLQAEDNVEKIKAVLEHIPKNCRLKLPSLDLLEKLRDVSLDVALIPPEVGIACDAKLSIDAAKAILQKLQNTPNISGFIITVIKACKEADKNDLADSINNLKIFEVTSVQGEQRWLSLQGLRKAPLLFKKRGNQDTFGSELEAVLDDDTHLALIDNTLADKLKENFALEIKSCNRDACIGVLEAKPRLVTESEPRLEFFDELTRAIKEYPNPTQSRALRYLLHANSEHFDDYDSTLFIPSEEDDKDVWNSICQKVLENQGKQWRWLEGFADLSEGKKNYKLEVASKESVEALLQEKDVRLPALIDEEYDALLEHINIDFLRRLPIHYETKSDKRVVITENTYLLGNRNPSSITSHLFEDVQFIKNHDDLDYRQISQPPRGLGLAELKPHDIIKQALAKPEPNQYMADILAMLPSFNPQSSSDDLKAQLKHKFWLQTRQGKLCAPSNVIWFAEDDPLRELAKSLLSKSDSFVSFDDLHEDIQKNEHMRKVLLERVDVLKSVCKVLSETPKYYIGELSALSSIDDSDETIKKWRGAFGDGGVFPVWNWLEHVKPTERGNIWRSVSQVINAETINDALKYLRERHKEGGQGKESVLEVHNWYLELAATTPDWQLTDDVLLLNQVGEWRVPSKLCHGQLNIDKEYLLSEEQAKILEASLVTLRQTDNRQQLGSVLSKEHDKASWHNINQQLEETVEILRGYFDHWRGYVKDEVIGVFLSVLGDHEGIKEYAQELLGQNTPYTVALLRKKLNADCREPLDDKLQQIRVVIKQEQQDVYEVLNLFNEVISVPKADHPETLFVGKLEHKNHDNYYYVGVRLANISPKDTLSDQLKSMLHDSIELLFRENYNYPRDEIDAVFAEVSDSSQIELRVAQDAIIDDAFRYLKSELKATSPKLKPLFDRWNYARYESSSLSLDSAARANQLDSVKQELKKLLDEDDDTHRILCKHVRKKLEVYQYKAESIPFELFQNADDALVELKDALDVSSNSTRTSSSQTFSIKSNEKGLYVMHWGRCINKSPGKGNTDYYRDLEKMLTLSASDKTTQVTGKFGLGFKSVFFLSDTPQIVSGSLAVEIVGGVYPKRLDSANAKALRSELERYGSEKQGTVIYLPAPAEDKQGQLIRLLKDFQPLAHYMLLFTRAVKRCEIIKGNAEPIEIYWKETSIDGLSNVVKRHYDSTTVLQFKTNVGSVVFKVGRDGIQPFKSDEKVPTLWVTAPTEGHSKLGFLINGDFDVDVGRAQLASSSSKNKEIAQQMAGELAEAFKKLAAMEWEKLCSALALDVSKEGFWRSLFDCLTQGFDDDKPVVELAKRIFWDEQGAASQLFNEYKVLPNGLTGELTQLSDVKHCVSGLLARDFEKFKSWLPESYNIISQKVYNTLKKCHAHTGIKELTLKDVLAKKLSDGHKVAPGIAQQLGWVITQQWLNQPQKSDTFNEMDEFCTFLNELRFQAQDGGHYRASQLLSTSLEAKSASIAPSNRRLHQNYQGEALNFFNVCRGDSAITLDEIAKWVLNASREQERKNAADCILVDAALSTYLSQQHPRVDQSWLNDEKLPWLAPKDLYQLRALLRLSEQSFDEEEDTHSFQLVYPDPERLLEHVYEKWQKERESRMAEHKRKTYPTGMELILKSDPDLKDPEQRKSWLVLLLLGSFLSLGRVKPEQNRGFLEDLNRGGWLDVFANPENKRQPDKWFDFIEAYFQRDTDQYRYWMTQFFNIYQFSSWLDDYVLFISGLDKVDDQTIDQTIRGIWNPNKSGALQGSGIYAPSLEKVLKLGRHFVLRELVRREVLTSDKLYPYCFVPSKRTRQTFAAMGCQVSGEDTMTASRQIYEFAKEYLGAKRATFDMDFDLPFYYGLHER